MKEGKYYQQVIEKYFPLKTIIDMELKRIITFYLSLNPDYDKNYITCNKILYFKGERKLINALLMKEKNYEAMLVSFVKRKRKYISDLNYTEFLRIRLKVFEINLYRFIMDLKEKYDFIAISLKTRSSLKELSRRTLGIQKRLIESM